MKRAGFMPELTFVRLCARTLAVAVVMLALFLLSRSGPRYGLSAGTEIAVVEVTVEQSAPPARRRARVKTHEEPIVASPPVMFAALEKGSIEAHLWTYDHLGRIVLNTSEQLRRCLRARAQRREEADCPNSGERRAMIARDAAAGDANPEARAAR